MSREKTSTRRSAREQGSRSDPAVPAPAPPRAVAEPAGRRVVILTGPTGAGKSRLALDLAERFAGEVVNADSMQVYRFMDIGTAKPGPEDRARVAHHLLDVVAPDEPYDAARYAREAREAAEAILARGKTVFLVGGTGLYIRAFLGGLIDSGGADPEIRRRLEAEDAAARAAGDPDRLHRRLADLDPDAARRIHPNDARRVVRALEICERTGRPASVWWREHGFADRPYEVLHLALDPGPEVLDEITDRRCEAMIARGLLQEARDLRDAGYGPELRPMRAIGYRHMQPVIDGVETLRGALAEMQRDTRRFARRQRTWLRKVPEAVFFDPRQPARVEDAVAAFLAGEADSAAGRALGAPDPEYLGDPGNPDGRRLPSAG